uniref:Major facilitator superfamily (MFS) profile domain-containing protein n=1 Tax=Ciona savignyi TaxID=51511 RepID=H2YY25_CIOSA
TIIPPKRSKCQMFMNSAIMFGREFCYAVEAGLTTPILLSIGLPSNLYSLVWVISPILGFVLQPIVGNLSDRCKCRWGRRRPFILALSILLILGMTLFLNGEQIVSHFDTNINGRRTADPRSMIIAAITVTIVGVVLFDFSADFIEGPIRAYAMDVCDEEDTKINLFYQAVFTGAGGAFGYASGGVAWTSGTPLGLWFPTDRQVIYTAAAVVFITTCVLNLTSIPESNPMLNAFFLKESDTTCTSLTNEDMNNVKLSPYAEVDPMQSKLLELRSKASSKKKLSANHLDLIEIGESVSDNELIQDSKAENSESGGLKSLMRSIASMPKDLRNLCVCHLFGWVAFLCMALFFTDFVGQVVMQGDPRSPTNSRLGTLYRGVEVGNWGLTINAAVSSIYCFLMKPLMRKIGPRSLYIFGYLTFSVGCLVVALVPSVYIVLCLSSIIGIMSATLYTVPYLLVAQYHENYKHWKGTPQERGIGTDCALVTCMIQLAQIITGLGIGALVNLTGTVTVTVITASIVALLGTLWAAFCVKY